MALQLADFKAQVLPHYTLAETFAEKDAATQREMARDAANNMAKGAMQTQELNVASANKAADRSANQQQLNVSNSRQAGLDQAAADQQAFQNQQILDTNSRQAGLDQAKMARQTQQDQIAADQLTRANAKDDLSMSNNAVDRQRADEEYKQKQLDLNRQHALTRIGDMVVSAKPDDNGMFNAKGLGEQFSKIYPDTKFDSDMQGLLGDDGKVRFNTTNNQAVLTPDGNPIAIDARVLKSYSQFAPKHEGKFSSKVVKGAVNKDLEQGPDQLYVTNDLTGETFNKTPSAPTTDETPEEAVNRLHAMYPQEPIENIRASVAAKGR